MIARVPLGKSGMEVTRICMGCWQFGVAGWTEVDDDRSVETIHKALELGINFLDTAEVYGRGHSEEVVGRAMAGRRDEAFIATKMGSGHTPDDARAALEASLKRLGVDYVDLYQVHWPASAYPPEKLLEAMAGWKEEGLIKAIGVSNFDLELMKKAVKITQVDSLQPPFSIVWREIDDLIPFCRDNGVMIMTYSSLAQGLILGKFKSKDDLPDDIRSKNVLTWDGPFDKVLEASRKVCEIAQKVGHSPAQVALRWVLQTPGIPCAIVGSRKPTQIEDLIGALDWQMDQADYDELSRLGREAFALVPVDTMWNWRPK